MTTIVGSLGTRQYDTKYDFGDGNVIQTKFFPLALARHLGANKVVFILTGKAEEANASAIGPERDALCPNVECLIKRIPLGLNEQDLWEMFDTLGEAIGNGEPVVFDITGGLRSIPFFMFLAINYLKVARDVNVEGVYYGAYELKGDDDNAAPVIDLTPALKLMDWITATDVFVRLGHGEQLAYLVRQEAPPEENPLKPFGKAIDDVSHAIWLSRPVDAMGYAEHLLGKLEKVKQSPPKGARPLALLLDRIQREYRTFAIPKDMANRLSWENLEKQIELVKWYVRRGHALQAYIISREWLVSLTQLILNHPQDSMSNKELREQVEKALKQYLNSPETTLLKEVAKTYRDIGQRRNDLMHAGMREGPMSLPKITQSLDELPAKLEELLRLAREEAQ